MGTAAQDRRERRSDKQILKDFGIEQMQADLQTMATTVDNLANRQTNLETNLKRKHDDLVKQVSKELSVELRHGGRATVTEVVGWHGTGWTA